MLLTGCSFQNNDSEARSRDSQEIETESPEGMMTGPVIEFSQLEHDFGKVREGEKAGWYFKYKNTGNEVLIIRSANASCGCTVPEFSKEPLSPGKEGMIKVIFDTSGRTGMQVKTVNIETNANNSFTVLKVIAEVVD